jgi:hypothetical protein
LNTGTWCTTKTNNDHNGQINKKDQLIFHIFSSLWISFNMTHEGMFRLWLKIMRPKGNAGQPYKKG